MYVGNICFKISWHVFLQNNLRLLFCQTVGNVVQNACLQD